MEVQCSSLKCEVPIMYFLDNCQAQWEGLYLLSLCRVSPALAWQIPFLGGTPWIGRSPDRCSHPGPCKKIMQALI